MNFSMAHSSTIRLNILLDVKELRRRTSDDWSNTTKARHPT